MSNRRPFIFISYSHKDTLQVLPLIEALKSRGFNLWYDAGIEAGSEWPEYIGTKLFECSCLLVFMTQNAADSSYCRREVEFADELEKPLLTVYLVNKEDMNLPNGLRYLISNKQAIFMKNSPTQDVFLDNLCQAEIMKPCRITDEWDQLYPPEEETSVEAIHSDANTMPRLKIPQAKEPEPEAAFPEGRNTPAHQYQQAMAYLESEKPQKAYPLFLSAAEKGHSEAMYQVAECYRLGLGVACDDQAAYQWYQKAGQDGVTAAMLRQAQCYEETNGTEKGRKKAFLLLSIAAKLNNIEAMYHLGLYLLEGIGTEKDIDAGIAWLKKAAEKDHTDAMCKLGTHYLSAPEDPDNLQQALHWLDCAAYWRHPDAMYHLAAHFEAKQQHQEADRWYLLAAQAGSAYAISRVLGFNHEAYSPEQTFKWYLKAAQRGDSHCMQVVADCYMQGTGISKDATQAASWYKKASDAGSLNAQLEWANCCAEGIGTPMDMETALSCYRELSSYHVSKATLALADCYRRGRGVAKDEKKAFELVSSTCRSDYCSEENYTLAQYYIRGIGTPLDPQKAFQCLKSAAEHYHTKAAHELAQCYSKGIGTEADPVQALHWYEVAAKNGIVAAMLATADRYAAGIGTDPSPVDAFAWYQRASEESNQAKYKQAQCYLQGFGTQADPHVALQLLYPLAMFHDFPEANLALAQYLGANGDLAEAANHYQLAAAAGNTEAYTVIRTAAWYRRQKFSHLRLFISHYRALKHYHANRDSYIPILLPWKKS